MLSVFFQVIVEFTGTVIVAGENAIPAMLTVLGVAGVLLLLLLFEQEK